MGRLALAVLVLFLEMVGSSTASIVDMRLEGWAGVLSEAALPNESVFEASTASNCSSGNSSLSSCQGRNLPGITYATTDLNWKQTLSAALTAKTPAKRYAKSLPGGHRYYKRGRVPGSHLRGRNQGGGKCGFWQLRFGRVVGNNYVYSCIRIQLDRQSVRHLPEFGKRLTPLVGSIPTITTTPSAT